jgi:DNA-binding IclR family transcriptional regulator
MPPKPAVVAGLVPSVTRALTLLDRLAERREPMSLARLATDLQLPKSSVHGLCNTLVSFGYLRRESDGGFQLGPRVMNLAEAFVAGTSVAQEFKAMWADATTLPEETIILSILDGTDVVYVATRDGARPLGLAFNVGMRLPAHLAASGKAMLAWLEPDEVRRLFPAGRLARMTRRGPADVDELIDELAAVRRRGYSLDDETVREGVYCMGAPVFDAARRPVAGIGVCVHRSLLGPGHAERHLHVVLEAARSLSQRLGGEPPPLPKAAARKPAAARKRTR